MTRDITYYRALPYKKMVWREDDGAESYFMAEIKELPGCLADGDTRSEALFNLKDAFDSYIEVSLEVGRDIPEPERRIRSRESYSIHMVSSVVGRRTHPVKEVIVPVTRTPERSPAVIGDRWQIITSAEEMHGFATATAYYCSDPEHSVTSRAEGTRVEMVPAE